MALAILGLVGVTIPSMVRAQDCDTYPDMALVPPPVNADPGSEYREWTRSYQGMPTIERMGNGRLWAAWTSGGINEGPLNYVVVVTSTDDGTSWSEPILVIDPPGNITAFVPYLWRDPTDHLWLFWSQGYGAWWDGRGGAWAIVTEGAESANPGWSDPRRLADGWPGGKPIALASGDWLLPVFVLTVPSELSEENEYYRLGLTPCVVRALSHDLGSLKGANVYRSADGGGTWELIGQATRGDAADKTIFSNTLLEHLLVERRDGNLWMLVRTAPGIGESTSYDGGRTWTPVKDSGIRHPLSRFFIRRLRSGRLLMVRHDPPNVTYPEGCEECGQWNRSHLTAYLSDDDGQSWQGGLLLDERETVSYPDGTEDADGRIYIIYDRDRSTQREILMATFEERDIMAGLCESEHCRLRVVISSPSL